MDSALKIEIYKSARYYEKSVQDKIPTLKSRYLHTFTM